MVTLYDKPDDPIRQVRHAHRQDVSFPVVFPTNGTACWEKRMVIQARIVQTSASHPVVDWFASRKIGYISWRDLLSKVRFCRVISEFLDILLDWIGRLYCKAYIYLAK